MTEYILILFYAVYGAATSAAILFPTKEACEVAKKATLEELRVSRAICVPRGTGQ